MKEIDQTFPLDSDQHDESTHQVAMADEDAGSTSRRRRGDLACDPELWAALGNGPGLTEVLTDFYSRVFADERLAPFFEGVTQDWLVQKQYSFLRDILTGSRQYFGHRPRNAHHWMVISDELFDHREDLMQSCLERYGLSPRLVQEFRAIDEVFRKQIVKDQPFPRKNRGIEVPLEGYDQLILTIGTLCDGCQGELSPNSTVSYHVRTGQTYCSVCRESRDEV